MGFEAGVLGGTGGGRRLVGAVEGEGWDGGLTRLGDGILCRCCGRIFERQEWPFGGLVEI